MEKMEPIEKLNELFFKANEIYEPRIKTHTVECYPGTAQDPHFFGKYDNAWFFRTYKEVVFAGLVWTRKLFNAPLTDLWINHFELGKKKQWFNVQIVKTGNSIIIDGENYNPFVNISYSYKTVHSIKFEIGFYRHACKNGVVSDYKGLLAKLKITPENLFEIPFWLNPCLLLLLSNRLEYQVKILKNTFIRGEDIKVFINQKFKNWKISDRIIERYIYDDKIGQTGYALLNILTDAASNFSEEEQFNLKINTALNDLSENDNTSNSERASRQRKVGQFLEKLIEEIEKENEIQSKLDINSPDFKLSTENIDLIEKTVIKEKYSFDLSKMKY